MAAVLRIHRDTEPEVLAASTVAALDQGDTVVWLGGSRRLGRQMAAAAIVHESHPGVVGTRDTRNGKSRTFWWPANASDETSVGWWH